MLDRPRGPLVCPEALLCDRDGTLVADVPYNDDPEQMTVLPGVGDALDRARQRGLHTGVITNQSGIAKGLIAPERLACIHDRLEQLIGPFDVIISCPHDAADRCRCRKPQPGLVLAAAATLDVEPGACVVVGDTWSDVAAAERAGATGILLASAPHDVDARARQAIVRPDLASAVDLVLCWRSAAA
jgi:histidinol-phosphate phosphatase family protein